MTCTTFATKCFSHECVIEIENWLCVQGVENAIRFWAYLLPINKYTVWNMKNKQIDIRFEEVDCTTAVCCEQRTTQFSLHIGT